MIVKGKAGIRHTALVCLSCLAAALLAGCGGGGGAYYPSGGGGGGGGGGGPIQPPPPPWHLTVYESGKASPAAEGTLTPGRDGYRLALDGDRAEDIVVKTDSIGREGDLVSLPVSRSQRESFREADLKRALNDIAQAQPTNLRSADHRRMYILRPAPAKEPAPEASRQK